MSSVIAKDHNEQRVKVVFFLSDVFCTSVLSEDEDEVSRALLTMDLMCLAIGTESMKSDPSLVSVPGGYCQHLQQAKQYHCYTQVTAVVRKVGLNVVDISADNASTNRKLYIHFVTVTAGV